MSSPHPSQTQALPIEQLEAHPLNSNVMPRALLDKLATEIGRTGLYPPIIVRPRGPRYQILDGHHRVCVLKELGHRLVEAVVWEVDDQQALLMLATLNRMRGEDDPRRRAALLSRLRESMGVVELAERLPEDAGRVKKMLELHAALPSPASPRPVGEMPVCVHFFLLPEQRRAVERLLREQGGSRESALLSLLGVIQETSA